ncbi:hypothetical protein PGT21_006660 [Puccinia graminis f. sp. tritici]|uniref:Uncharacterized protein n=1 Tax=Puccinia graminis f. sp. tritici TaxID=56615 RepID=A0A5B0LWX6_PUCGR|nr:hypothetical protein PGT21_006660 [Puccinia graminis f. sp. tritici]
MTSFSLQPSTSQNERIQFQAICRHTQLAVRQATDAVRFNFWVQKHNNRILLSISWLSPIPNTTTSQETPQTDGHKRTCSDYSTYWASRGRIEGVSLGVCQMLLQLNNIITEH